MNPFALRCSCMHVDSLQAPRSGDDIQEYGWVNRHTWQSWRERYVKHKQYFNRMIDEIVADLPLEQLINDPRDGRFGRPHGRRVASSDEEEFDALSEGDGTDEEFDRAYRRGVARPWLGGRATGSTHESSRGKGRRQASWESSPEHRRAPRAAPSSRRDKGKGRADPPHADDMSEDECVSFLDIFLLGAYLTCFHIGRFSVMVLKWSPVSRITRCHRGPPCSPRRRRDRLLLGHPQFRDRPILEVL